MFLTVDRRLDEIIANYREIESWSRKWVFSYKGSHIDDADRSSLVARHSKIKTPGRVNTLLFINITLLPSILYLSSWLRHFDLWGFRGTRRATALRYYIIRPRQEYAAIWRPYLEQKFLTTTRS